MSFGNKLMLKDWNHRTLIMDTLNLEENNRLQEELAMKEKLLRDTQMRNIQELGEMKRAQELRVDAFSVHK